MNRKGRTRERKTRHIDRAIRKHPNNLLERIDEARRAGSSTLNLAGRDLDPLPPQIGQLTNLQKLVLKGIDFKSLPPEIGQLTNLEELSLRDTRLDSLPVEIGQLSKLRTLCIYDSLLASLPPAIGQLRNLRKLDLGGPTWGVGLESLPMEIGQLVNLEELSLQSQQLRALPRQIGQLHKLRTLSLSVGGLESLPLEVFQLFNLEELYLAGNQFTSLPPEIGRLTKLQRLNLYHNQLKSLPREICQLTNLHLLDLGGNPLVSPWLGIAMKGIEAIREWFREQEEEERAGRSSRVKETRPSNPAIPSPLLNLALDYVLFPSLKAVSRDSFDVVRFTSDGKTLLMDATDGSRIWGAEIEIKCTAFQFFVSVEDCQAIKSYCNGRITDGWSAVAIDWVDPFISLKSSEEGHVEFHPEPPTAAVFPSSEEALEVRIESINPSDDPSESKRRDRIAETLLWLEGPGPWGFPHSSEEPVTVVHRFGESMSCQRGQSSAEDNFLSGFGGWIRSLSQSMTNASRDEVVITLRSAERFADKILVFESLREIAEWEDTLEYTEFAAVFPETIEEGFPIFELGLGGDGLDVRKKSEEWG
ncbi:MAG: leucine-rich repeat domain-containing protein [Candidatus Omnitrophica bacterium]|nr:leucine-rich repeat domain-containing protein [Candidatus Omnitrophota bacterium]